MQKRVQRKKHLRSQNDLQDTVERNESVWSTEEKTEQI